ncbi:hypothetical protein EJ08DRAFT_331452 [Tothia fuscella]|uniref:Uncharacterized protein n=1 Tax=Tothia fuscella TaxID=1048955 RepID=A0A9P4NM44_9PEZI|nr:hypothetical protein EJ08DRAFT_331452 [Tothia fuscella]
MATPTKNPNDDEGSLTQATPTKEQQKHEDLTKLAAELYLYLKRHEKLLEVRNRDSLIQERTAFMPQSKEVGAKSAKVGEKSDRKFGKSINSITDTREDSSTKLRSEHCINKAARTDEALLKEIRELNKLCQAVEDPSNEVNARDESAN